MSDVTAFYNGGSNHKLIYAVRHSKNICINISYVRKRCFKNFIKDDFIADIREVKWFEVYMCTNVEAAVELLTEKLTNVLDNHAPLRTIQIRSRYAPWSSDETKGVMDLRNRAQQVARIQQDVTSLRVYKNLRNRVNNMIKRDKNSWERK